MFLLPHPTNRLTCETTQRPNPFYLGLTRHDERNDRLYDPRYFLLFECYLAEFRVSVPHSALTLLPRCRTDVLPSCLSLSLPYVARQEPAPAGKPSSPQLSVFFSHCPCPHAPSYLHPFVKERCWMYRLLNFRSAGQVGAAKLFPRHLHPRPFHSDAFDSRPKMFHSVEWMPW